MSKDHKKDFDIWNKVKKLIEKDVREVFAYPRDVWWCSLGVNVGAEIDGKNDGFERPVIVMNVYNKDTLLVLPTTGRAKADKFHAPLDIKAVDWKTGEVSTKTVFVKLTQARVISNKRLIRKVGVIDQSDFLRIQKAFRPFT
jgi:mRNA-degrading endonuclease toxin of MazEF toxin-antitoxin module